MSIDLMLTRWDRLFAFMRRAYPNLDKYGVDTGGDAEALVRCFQKTDEMDRIARALHQIDLDYSIATRESYQKIDEAIKARADAERYLLNTIP